MSTLEWLAALIALGGAWMIGSQRAHVRKFGFLMFLISNSLWITWGGLIGAWGLVTMQTLFCVTSLRGMINNSAGKQSHEVKG